MIGIVILNYENWEDTKRCMKSVIQNPPKEAYRIFLVDNASEKEPDAELKRLLCAAQAEFIRSRKNVGYNAGNNIGIAKAQAAGCDSILIANNDICFTKGSIQEMKDFLVRYPHAGIVGPQILDSSGHIQRSCIFRKTGMKEKYFVRTRAGMLFWKSREAYFGRQRDYGRVMRAYAVLGCCFMISERCAKAVAPFDEHPFLYEEELILGICMEEQGFITMYDPNAVVMHIHGASTRQRKAFAFAHNVRSEIYYCSRYLKAGRRQIYPLYWYRVALYFIRCCISRDFRQNWKWFIRMTQEEIKAVRS